MLTHSGAPRVIALFVLIAFLSGCTTIAPSPTPTSEDNPIAGAIQRATNIVFATQAAASTADAQATLDESATQAADRAAQTEQARLDATATVVAQATRAAMLAEQQTWPVLVTDSFADNQLDWPLGRTADSSLSIFAQIAADRYEWTVNIFNGNSYFNLIPTQGPALDKFYAAVTVQFKQASRDGMAAYGLTFRHVEDDYGFFGITNNGLYRILEVHHTGIYQLWMSDSAFIDTRPGALNRLAVIGVGPDFLLLINDQVVAQWQAEIAPGQIGLGVDAIGSSPEVIVAFSDFQINAPK